MSSDAPQERVVIKIGTSSLVSDGRPDPGKLAALADAVVRLRGEGIQPVVIGSGAIAVGNARLAASGTAVVGPAARQVAAAVGQGLLYAAFHDALAARGLVTAQILLTPPDLTGPEHRDSVRAILESALAAGLVPVVNENDAVMVRNNDVLAALLAGVLGADRLLLLTDVPGLYESDPRRDRSARRIPEIAVMTPGVERLAGAAAGGLGTGGMAAKLCAAWIATLAGVPVVIAGADTEDGVVRAMAGADIGTLVHPRAPERDPDLGRVWRALSEPPAGRLLCTPEGVAALAGGGVLTARYIESHEGVFEAGSTVDAVDGDRRIIVRGRARLGSFELHDFTDPGQGPAVLHPTDYVTLPEA
ncbi:glutamate 5-kinase [Streptomyces sp. NBC_00102]|uniref:glutamate 5-kinase n=1 Tax=Streptomyces sp. NBC_00102 TaxID=2975652 RepID=UPI00225940FE|nr:glutamate 5-kinase [Streptomyces sp. NBC_00102]MCX5400297.1 glutamate 5-kinase [Streptomyces sp. NBC_00102]